MARKNLLKGFKRPKGITFEHGETNENYGKFVAYPFERGYGTTIGNTLRRILLSSIQGYAVTALKITSYDEEGTPRVVSSEFESIPHVIEDTPIVVSNLRQLEIKLPNEEDQKLVSVDLEGAGEVTGKDIEEKSDIEILNKDQYVLTMMEDAKITIEMQVDLNRGYIPSEVNEK